MQRTAELPAQRVEEPFQSVVENASAQLLADWSRDEKQLDKYERAKNACGCKKCTAQYDRFIRELAEKWQVPDEDMLCVVQTIQRHIPQEVA